MDKLAVWLAYPDFGRDGRVFESRHPDQINRAMIFHRFFYVLLHILVLKQIFLVHHLHKVAIFQCFRYEFKRSFNYSLALAEA